MNLLTIFSIELKKIRRTPYFLDPADPADPVMGPCCIKR